MVQRLASSRGAECSGVDPCQGSSRRHQTLVASDWILVSRTVVVAAASIVEAADVDYVIQFFYVGTLLYQFPKDKWTDTIQYARYWLKIDQPVILSEREFAQLCAGWIESQKTIEARRLMLIPKRKPGSIVSDANKRQNNHDLLTATQCGKLQAFTVEQRIRHNALNCVTDISNVARKTCFASPAIFLDNIERQWEGTLLLKDEALIKDKLDSLNPDSPVPLPDFLTGGIAALFAALIFFTGKSMALLGLSSMQLFQSVLTRLRGIPQPAEKVGTRLLFEDYFKPCLSG